MSEIGVFQLVDTELYFNIGLTSLGILVILRSINVSRNFKEILSINDYKTFQWFLVQVLMLFFTIAYIIHLVSLTDFFELPIDDSNNLVAKILQYAGISIRESDVFQFGQLEDQQQNQTNL